MLCVAKSDRDSWEAEVSQVGGYMCRVGAYVMTTVCVDYNAAPARRRLLPVTADYRFVAKSDRDS